MIDRYLNDIHAFPATLLTEHRVECLSWILSLPSFILDGNDFLSHRSKLDPQDAVL
jgi:hypothetical protein